MAGRSRLDVVVLTWDDGALLARAVASALADDHVEVTVVDNGSAPPAEIVDPRLSLIRSEVNLGVARGRNLGVRAGSAPLVCLLDSDARLAPGSFAALLAPLLADPTIGLSAPVFVGQRPRASAGRAPSVGRKLGRAFGLTSTYASLGRQDGDWWEVDFAIGACQVFRREAFEAVGGLDESYFYGPEDVDFCLRLKHAGWRVVQVAGAGVVHPPRRRNRRLLTRRGAAHALAVGRHLWRHKRSALGLAS